MPINLQVAKLQEANLYKANLSNTDLRQVGNLTRDQLQKAWAWADRAPLLPDGWTIPLCPIEYREDDTSFPWKWIREPLCDD